MFFQLIFFRLPNSGRDKGLNILACSTVHQFFLLKRFCDIFIPEPITIRDCADTARGLDADSTVVAYDMGVAGLLEDFAWARSWLPGAAINVDFANGWRLNTVPRGAGSLGKDCWMDDSDPCFLFLCGRASKLVLVWHCFFGFHFGFS